MARKKPDTATTETRERIDLRAETSFISRLRRQAERFTDGNISAYLRLAAVERLERDEASDPRPLAREES